MKLQSPITHIVGIDIRTDDNSIRLSQERALNVVLEPHGYANVPAVPSAPLPMKWSPDPGAPGDDVGGSPPRSLDPAPRSVNSGTCGPATRRSPPPSTPSSPRSQSGSRATRALARILRYLAGTRWQEVTFSRRYTGRFEMVAYAGETLASELAVGARGLALSRIGGAILLNGTKVWERQPTSDRVELLDALFF